MIKKTREQELTSQLIQAEKMAALGLLVAGVAHEINTPMGAIHSNNDIMRRAVAKIRRTLEPDTNKEAVRLLGILEEVCRNNETAAERIMHIVRSLKNFARLDEAERKRVDLHEGIESTLTLLQHQLKSRIRIERQFGNIPEVLCHPNQLNQVFMNILANAAQAIPGAGVIRITTLTDGNFVKIAVADTGGGILPEHLSKIFDPGFTTKGVGLGTGLGLSICYKIVEDHGGTIEVDSSPSGTTLTITLPINGR
jgi:two-component system, NtrC family, sensor kinase